MQSLLFAFLDELLFVFSTEFFVIRELRVQPIDRSGWEMHVSACAPRVRCLGLRAARCWALLTWRGAQAREPLRARAARAGHGGT